MNKQGEDERREEKQRERVKPRWMGKQGNWFGRGENGRMGKMGKRENGKAGKEWKQVEGDRRKGKLGGSKSGKWGLKGGK